MRVLNSYAIIALCCFCTIQSLATNTKTQKFTISAHLSGGIKGIQNSIRPDIEFDAHCPIFKDLIITPDDVGKSFEIASNIDDPNFTKFAQRLTDVHDEVMKVGHFIGFVKGNLGNYETTWFGEADFNKKYISKISITYDTLDFDEPMIKDNDFWTNFKYSVSITFYVSETSSINMNLVDFSLDEELSDDFQTKGESEQFDKKKLTIDAFVQQQKKQFKAKITYTRPAKKKKTEVEKLQNDAIRKNTGLKRN